MNVHRPHSVQLTPAQSNANLNPLESLDSFTEDVDALLPIKGRKQTLPVTPNSPSLSTHNQSGVASPTFPAHIGTLSAATFKMERLNGRDDHKEKSKEDKPAKSGKQPVAECTMKEVMQHVANLTSEVLPLPQNPQICTFLNLNKYSEGVLDFRVFRILIGSLLTLLIGWKCYEFGSHFFKI